MWMTLSNLSKTTPMKTTNSIATGFTILDIGEFVGWEELEGPPYRRGSPVVSEQSDLAFVGPARPCVFKASFQLFPYFRQSVRSSAGTFVPYDGLQRFFVRSLLEPLEASLKRSSAWRYSRGRFSRGEHHGVSPFFFFENEMKDGQCVKSSFSQPCCKFGGNQTCPTSTVDDAFCPLPFDSMHTGFLKRPRTIRSISRFPYCESSVSILR